MIELFAFIVFSVAAAAVIAALLVAVILKGDYESNCNQTCQQGRNCTCQD